MDQITDLIERLIYRVKQKETLEKKEQPTEAGLGAKSSPFMPKKDPPPEIKFQSGKSLPTIDDGKAGAFDFPSLGVGSGFGGGNKPSELTGKAK